VFFINDQTGYIVGYPGCILKTNDGGINWTNSISGLQADLISVFFADTLTGYAVGSNGTILKTIDGGISIQLNQNNNSPLRFYPNPVEELLHIELNDPRIQESEVLIYTLTGRLVSKYKIPGNTISLDVVNLQSGLYIAKINNKDQTVSFKFLKH
jgi:hypothetical protein